MIKKLLIDGIPLEQSIIDIINKLLLEHRKNTCNK